MDYKNEIYARTNNGLDVFQYYLPFDGVTLPADLKKHFRLRQDDGTPSASLSFKDGAWILKDFGDARSAMNCFDYVMDSRSLSFTDAVDTILRDMLGTDKDSLKDMLTPHSHRKPVRNPPTQKKTQNTDDIDTSNLQELDEKVISSLSTKRGFSKLTVNSFPIKQSVRNGKTSICFLYEYKGLVKNIKQRFTVKDKQGNAKKTFIQTKDAYKTFWLVDTLENASKGVLVEGEMDVLAIYEAYLQLGLTPPKVITPSGGANSLSENLDNCFDEVSSVGEWVVFGDNDAVGRKMAEEFIQRIGKHKCRVVVHPESCKDPNDVLLKCSAKELVDVVENAELIPIEGLLTVNDLDSAIQRLWDEGLKPGLKCGYKQFDEQLSFETKQLTVITGPPNMGKTAFLNQLLIRLAARHGSKAGIWSPEYGMYQLNFKDLAEIYTGKQWRMPNQTSLTYMNDLDLAKAKEFIGKHFYFYEPPQDYAKRKFVRPTKENILQAFEGVIQRYGIKFVVIDPYNKISRADNQYLDQGWISNFLADLCSFASFFDVHVFLVAHPKQVYKSRKVEINKNGNITELEWYKVVGPYDIYGGSEFFNQAFNIMSINMVPTDIDEYGHPCDYDTEVHTSKVKFKHIGKKGMVNFLFDRHSNRFYEKIGGGLLSGYEDQWEEGEKRNQEMLDKMPSSTYFDEDEFRPRQLGDSELPF